MITKEYSYDVSHDEHFQDTRFLKECVSTAEIKQHFSAD